MLAIELAGAQEGFPLDGTWRGQLSAGSEDSATVVVIMKWDGEHINGMFNPGPKSIPFTSAELDPSNWGVHIEAARADGVQISVRGTLTEIGSYNRKIVGTWSEDGSSQPVELVRE